MPDVFAVVLVALVAGSATGLGAIPVLLAPRIDQWLFDTLIGFAAGILVGAAVFALLSPAIAMGTPFAIVGGLASGYLFLTGVDRLLLRKTGSISDSSGDESPDGDPERRALLIGGTVTLHNVPEGLAVGIAFATGAETVAVVLAIAIGIQNLSDGFTVAVAAHDTSLSKRAILGYTTLTGAVPEPIAAFIGFTLATSVSALFPVVAAFAAGVILTVVYTELMPLCRRHGHERSAAVTFLAGLSVILLMERLV